MKFRNFKYALALVAFGNCFLSFSQNISRSVVAPAGNYSTNSNGSLYGNAGEVITNSLFSSNNIVTQGFVQPPNPIATAIGLNAINETNVSLFPNPAHNIIHFELTKSNTKIAVEIIDIQGRQINLEEEVKLLTDNSYLLNIDKLFNGVFFIKIFDTETHSIIEVIKVVKI